MAKEYVEIIPEEEVEVIEPTIKDKVDEKVEELELESDIKKDEVEEKVDEMKEEAHEKHEEVKEDVEDKKEEIEDKLEELKEEAKEKIDEAKLDAELKKEEIEADVKKMSKSEKHLIIANIIATILWLTCFISIVIPYQFVSLAAIYGFIVNIIICPAVGIIDIIHAVKTKKYVWFLGILLVFAFGIGYEIIQLI